MQPEFDMTGRKAIVTGAARGLGKDIALGLARYGVDVTLWDIDGEELKVAAAEIEALGRKAWTQVVDVTKVEELDAHAELANKNMGRIDYLVNNAGVNKPQPTAEITPQIWDLVLNINLRGAFFCAQAVGKIMIKQNYGKIVNMSSQCGQRAAHWRAAYCASKGAIDQVTRVMAYEWAKYNITTNSVAPTFVETAMTKDMLADKDFSDYVYSKLRIQRLAKSGEVTAAVLYLLSPGADMVTGHVLTVDGGWTIH